jgi:uncharacterized protein
MTSFSRGSRISARPWRSSESWSDARAVGWARDAGADWSGITLGHNVGFPEQGEVIELARSNGAQITREPAETFYGGYAGVFRDLDGHAWEIAHNPSFGLADDGSVILPTR